GGGGGGGGRGGEAVRGVAEEDRGVMQAGYRQDRRIDLVADVLVRRIRLHVRVDVRVVQRVAPFLPLRHGERQRGVQDGGQRVHERDLRDDPAERLRGDVG